MNYFPFLISTHRFDCRIFFYPLMCFWHYPRQYMNIVMCTYFYIISMANSITSRIQSVRCLRNVLRAIFLYRKIRKIHPPYPLSPPPPREKKSQQPKANSNWKLRLITNYTYASPIHAWKILNFISFFPLVSTVHVTYILTISLLLAIFLLLTAQQNHNSQQDPTTAPLGLYG